MSKQSELFGTLQINGEATLPNGTWVVLNSTKQSELKAINRYIAEYAKRWEVAREQWVKVMIWEIMIKRSRLQFKGGSNA